MLTKAVGTYHKALDEAPWPERIKAADRITQYHDHGWDPQVRRERARAQGDMATSFFKKKLSDQDLQDIEKKDVISND